jgi:hypothetical protein
MRRFCLLVAAVLCSGGAVAAEEGWQEFSYPDAGFAAQYPSPPKMDIVDYKTAQAPDGVVKQRVYSANNGGVVYSVSIADFKGTPAQKDKTIDEAVSNLAGLGTMTHNESGARIDGNYGREVRVEDAKGTTYTDAIFFIENKLYELKVVYPAVNSDPNGSSGIHFFQQAFYFLH